MEVLSYEHPWGRALIPAEVDAAWESAQAAGDSPVLETTATFLTMLKEPNVAQLLPYVVTPESLPAWPAELTAVRDLLGGRGMAFEVDYPAEHVAYVKLPPDPGDVIRATGDVLLAGAVIVTLQRRPELSDVLGLGGWRVHAVGDYLRPQDLPRI